MADGPGEWVNDGAFVMPMLPASLRIDPILAGLLHVAAFLELSGDEMIDPDRAVEAMEHISHYLHQLPTEREQALREQVSRVADHARKKK